MAWAPSDRVPRGERLSLDGRGRSAPRPFRYKMNALQRHFSPSALAASFAKNRAKFRKASSAGIDGIDLADFDDELSDNIDNLSDQILGGKYRHKPLKAFCFTKRNGSLRWICVPTIRDRLVQRRIVEVILLENPSRLRTSLGFGALKKVGADAEISAIDVALRTRQEFPWVVKTDIASFFDQLPREHAFSAFRRVCRKRSLHALVEQVIRTEAQGDHQKMSESGIVLGRGIRQGMPLSPLIAHITLIELDRALEEQGVKFVRYVDDLIFLGSNKDEVVSAFYFAKNWLEKNRDLRLPNIGEKKTEICPPSRLVEFLGIDLYQSNNRYRLKIPDKKFKSLDGRFSEKSTINFKSPTEGQVLSALRFVASARRSYAGVYRNLDNWKAFELKIKDYERRSIRTISQQLCPIANMKSGIPPEVLKAFGVKT